ncbi:cytochrome P450 [Nocardia sp. 2YAB30]|uniref:cytochrome P450 n=1 Tax=unclassified Nocardia TaxID=2637762 RepID=UPI003F990171
MKPSDFPRAERFHTPGPVIVEEGVAHLRSYADLQRAMLDDQSTEFAQDTSYWAPAGERIHIAFYFMWATGKWQADGSPGRHDVLRGLVEPYFRTRAVATLRPAMEKIAKALVREIIEKGTGEFDLADEFAYRMSLRNICGLVGLPLEREQWMRTQLSEFTERTAFDQAKREPQEVEDYFWAIIRHRVAHPEDDLLGLLAAAWQAGSITDLELLGYIWGMFSAGTDTTGTNLVNAFALLGEFGLLGDARAKLDDADWYRWAGEEILRFGTPFPAAPLFTVTDVVVNDGELTLPAGTQVRAWFSAANRDNAINGADPHAAPPDVFDVTRRPNRHLALGSGGHHCIGAQLARVETHIALQTALRYLPDLDFDTGQPFTRYAGLVDGVTEAHFRFDQRKAERLLGEL